MGLIKFQPNFIQELFKNGQPLYKPRDSRVALNPSQSNNHRIPEHQQPSTHPLNLPKGGHLTHYNFLLLSLIQLSQPPTMAESEPNTQQLPAASPSPPPPAPIPQAPGPRASRLHQVFDQALARTLRANSYANFASCFPTPARHVPASLESVWRQLNAKLEESAKAEFEEIIAERDVVPHLNELDRLVGEARVRREQEGENGNSERTVYVEHYNRNIFGHG
jgi:hypothetical protein